jgi:hypothetical protein
VNEAIAAARPPERAIPITNMGLASPNSRKQNAKLHLPHIETPDEQNQSGKTKGGTL